MIIFVKIILYIIAVIAVMALAVLVYVMIEACADQNRNKRILFYSFAMIGIILGIIIYMYIPANAVMMPNAKAHLVMAPFIIILIAGRFISYHFMD